MRLPTFIIVSLIALLSAAPGFAQSLADYPGWRLDQTKPLESVDANNLEYKDFFTLTPPGARAPITVDGSTAARLLEGQLNPETVYAERTAGGEKKKDDGSGGNGNGAVGWQVAESTYVPVGEEKSRNPATAITGSSSYGGMAGSGASSGASIAGGGAGTSGTTGGGSSSNFSVGGGNMNFANSSSGGSGGAFNNFSGGSAGKPVSNGGTASASSNIDTSNMTYSQMIESANTEATKSACARMGSYAQGGFCK